MPHICDQDGVKINLMGPEVPREKNTLSEIPFWASRFYSKIPIPQIWNMAGKNVISPCDG